MFGRRFHLFTVAGIPIRVDVSWFFIAILIAWSLAVGLFPRYMPGLAPGTYWGMGIAGALLLFACVLLHELGHAVVAQRFGVEMRGITLFIFGGVAEMGDEPPSARAEFFVAIAGPIVSVALAVLMFFGTQAPAPRPVHGVISYLFWINALLVAFNMLPAFPLDGGRVLRAALWQWKDDLRWATRIASSIGSGFGVFLMLLAIPSLLIGDLVGAIWWFILGMFLRNAAEMSYQQVLWRQLLEGTSVRRLMNAEPRTVPPDLPVDQFVDDYVYHYHYKSFPTAQNGRLLGCVTTEQVKRIPREEWSKHTVGEIAEPCTPENTIDGDADAVSALAKMSRTGRSRLMAVEGDRLVGIIALRDMLSYITRRVELEGLGHIRIHPTG